VLIYVGNSTGGSGTTFEQELNGREQEEKWERKGIR